MTSFDPRAYVRTLHPRTPGPIEVVAYEHREGGLEVFAFEPAGVLPGEWEAHRVDPNHVYLMRVDDADQLENVVLALARKLGADYEKVVGYREKEPGQKTQVSRLLHRIHKRGATGYALQTGTDGCWELVLRRRDLPLLAEEQ